MTRFGLIGAGAVGRSLLSRIPLLGYELGPVASFSYRFAVRICNALGAGSPLRQIDALDGCEVIVVCAPGTGFDRLISLLLSASLQWHCKTVLFCDSDRYSSEFPEFRQYGAAAGSLNPIVGFPTGYVVEGDRPAIREAKRIAKKLNGKPIEVDGEKIQIYNAALTICTSLFTPLMDSCVECIRTAGIQGPLASKVAEALFQRAIRAYVRAGRKSWSGPVARGDRRAIDRQFGAMQKERPLLADYYRASADYAFALYQSFPELTRYNKQKWADFARGAHQD